MTLMVCQGWMRAIVPMGVAASLCLFFGTSVEASELIKLSGNISCPITCDPSLGLEGYTVDIARAIFEPLGYKIVYQILPWQRAIQDTRAGRESDGVLGAVRDDATNDFIFPRLEAGIERFSLFKLKRFQWKYSGARSLDAVQIGISNADLPWDDVGKTLVERSRQPNSNVQTLFSHDATRINLEKLIRGRIDLVMDDDAVLVFESQVPAYRDKMDRAMYLGDGKPIYIAFAPHDSRAKTLSEIFDAGMRRLRKSGELKHIMARYGMSDWAKESGTMRLHK